MTPEYLRIYQFRGQGLEREAVLVVLAYNSKEAWKLVRDRCPMEMNKTSLRLVESRRFERACVAYSDFGD